MRRGTWAQCSGSHQTVRLSPSVWDSSYRRNFNAWPPVRLRSTRRCAPRAR
jgi:hypothetical protein